MICEWPVSYAECGEGSSSPCSAYAGLDADQIASWEGMAAEYLWNWTGQVYGVCDAEVWPCRDGNGCAAQRTTVFEGRGPFSHLPAPSTLPPRPRTHPSTLLLPGPVSAVTSVVLGGVALDPANYRLNGSSLIRVDNLPWPSCGSFEPVEADWAISYKQGIPVPLQGRLSAGILACELAKASCNDSTCKLPQRIQTITRQGVTMAMLDPMDDIDKGHTGIWTIDSWVSSVTRPSRGGRVHSVDLPRPGSGSGRVSSWPLT